MKRIYQLFAFALFTSAMVLFTGCTKEEQILPDNSSSIDTRGPGGTLVPSSATMYGLTANNELVKITTSPFTIGTPVPITSRITRETIGIRAIDFRPGSTRLYGVGADNILYTIDVVSGVATAVSLPATPFSPGINGGTVGFDYNTADNTLRLVTDANQNIRINALTGQVVGIDQNIRPDQLDVNGIAYGGASSGLSGGSGTLYAIETTTSRLYKMNASLGSLSSVGPLGVTMQGEAGFDIGYKGGAYAVFYGGNGTSGIGTAGTANDNYLFNINTGNGSAKVVGRVPAMIGLAVQ